LFIMRMFVKYGSLPDLISLRRKTESIKKEVGWLWDDDVQTEALLLLLKYCPVIDDHLFIRCIETLNSYSPLRTRVKLARHVRKRLKVYAKHTFFERGFAYFLLFQAELRRRLGTKQKNKVLQAGGAMIAIIGADATGKSTLVAETERWLGNVFAVKVIHTGKPPSSGLTLPINIVLALVRGLISRKRSSGFNKQPPLDDSSPTQHKFRGVSSLLYAVRAVVLARDRLRLILRARRRVAWGEIIICDRYPSNALGAMDSPRLTCEKLKSGPVVAIYNRLVWLEKKLYKQIPPPDIVLKLKVSLDTALKRNRERNGQDEKSYLKARHRQSQMWYMPGTKYVNDIDTEQSLPETIHAVKTVIWESL